MARLGPSLSRADLPSYCMRSLAPGRLRPLPPSSTSLRPPSPASCEQQTSLPPTLDLGVSKPSSVGGGQSLRFCQVAGAGVRARIRQVWVHATEGARELASAYVPSRGLQMCLRIWEAAPGEREDKRMEGAEEAAGWEAEPICMQQEQEPSKAALQRSLNSQGIGGSTATSMPAEPSPTHHPAQP